MKKTTVSVRSKPYFSAPQRSHGTRGVLTSHADAAGQPERPWDKRQR